MIIGINSGAFGTAGAADVRACVGTARLSVTELSITTFQNHWNAGIKVVADYSPFNSGGVVAMNATNTANNAVAWYSANTNVSKTPWLEIFNEPALSGSGWGSNASSTANSLAYAKMLKAFALAFRARYPDPTQRPLLLASWDGGASGNDVNWGNHYWFATDATGGVTNVGQYVDGITMHSYSFSNSVTTSEQRLKAGFDGTGKPVYCTETGWATAPVGSVVPAVSQSTQAANITQLATWMSQQSWMALWTYFCYRDFSGNAWGIEDSGGGKKQSYAALHNAYLNFDTGVVAPPPPTPTAPTVTTSSPSGVSAAGGASLFAQVNPNQLSTTVVFDEGPTTAYGNHLAATPNPIPAGTSPVQAQASLAGPLPAGTRHVRASATNTQGTTVGNDVAYTVPSGAVPLQVQITLGSPTSQVNLVSSSIDPTVTQVRFASTAANDANAPTYQNFSSPFPATFTPPLGQPWVNVSAYDASGAQVGVWQDAVAGRSRIQTTPAAGVAPTVTTVAATQITASGATLNGTANLNGQPSGQATIQYGATTGYGSTAGPVTVTGTAGSSGSITFDAAHSGSVAPGTSIPVAATGANGSFQLGIFGGKGTGATQPNLTAPSTSWSRFLTHAFSSTAGGAHLLGLYSKVAASEGTTTWVSDQNQNQAVVVFAAAGVAATSSIRSSASFFNDASNTCQCPSVSAVAGDVLLYGGQFTNGDTATFPAGATNVTQVTTGAGVADVTVFVGMETIATTGLTGIRQITLNNTYGNGADPSVGFSVVVAPSGTATGVPFSIPVTGVPASTLRHYKAFVTTAGGTSSGSDLSFTTLSAGGSLPGVTWSTPTCVSAQGVSFAGNVDAGSQSTDWKFQYRAKGDTAWTDGPGGNTTVTKLVSGTVSPGLAFSTLYEAQLTATNATGTVTTTVHTFTTSASGHHKFAVGDNVYVLDVSTPGAPDSLLGQTGQVDLCTTTLVTVSFATGEVVAFAPWALRSPP